MTLEELEYLEALIAGKREGREAFNLEAAQAKIKAKALSEEIRALEAKLPAPKERRGIVMKVNPATMVVKPRR